jgi:signal peptidase II
MLVARNTWIVGLVLPCIACDQATKAVARQTLASGELISFFDGAVRLQLAENMGGFLSMGAALPDPIRGLLFFVLVPASLIFLLFSLLRWSSGSVISSCGLALMLAGGVGNFIDRLHNDGAVIDFVSVGLGSLRSGIFNVSDVAIVIGGGLLVYAIATGKGRHAGAGLSREVT